MRRILAIAVVPFLVVAFAAAGTSVARNRSASCSINMYRFSYYNGDAVTDSSQTCSGVDSQTLYVVLKEYWKSDSSWHVMDTGPTSSGGNGTIYAGAKHSCSTSKYNEWENDSYGSDTYGLGQTSSRHTKQEFWPGCG